MGKRIALKSVAGEFAGADLGDGRRSKRLKTISGLLEREPQKGFPRAMGSDAALEGLYRFINNDAFSAADILAPHIAATLERAAQAGPVIAVHDTTYVEFKTSREDLGLTTGKNRFGFAAHSTLVLTEREGLPLGVAHVETLSRAGEKWKKRKKEGKRHHVDPHDANRESLRWLRGVEAIESSSGALDVVHVIDAEGDFFELMAALHDKSARFVIRAGQLDRLVVHNDEAIGLREVVDSIEPRTSRKVELSERKHAPRTCISTRRRHPQRSGRRAKLAIGVTRNCAEENPILRSRRGTLRAKCSARLGAQPASRPAARGVGPAHDRAVLHTESTEAHCRHLPQTLGDRGILQSAQDGLLTGMMRALDNLDEQAST